MATAGGATAATDSGSSSDAKVAAEVPFSDFCKYVRVGGFLACSVL